jgi:hypothetical protein
MLLFPGENHMVGGRSLVLLSRGVDTALCLCGNRGDSSPPRSHPRHRRKRKLSQTPTSSIYPARPASIPVGVNLTTRRVSNGIGGRPPNARPSSPRLPLLLPPPGAFQDFAVRVHQPREAEKAKETIKVDITGSRTTLARWPQPAGGLNTRPARPSYGTPLNGSQVCTTGGVPA